MQRTRTWPGRQAGLTMWELLVVMAITAVLAVIVLPVLTPGIERQPRARCLSNLRQIGTAAALYADDNAGLLLWNPYYTSPGRDKQANYVLCLSPYHLAPETWVCPSAPLAISETLSPGRTFWVSPDYPLDTRVYPRLSYGMNEVMIGWGGDPSGVGRHPASLKTMHSPASIALFGDSDMMYGSYATRVVNGTYSSSTVGIKPGEMFWTWADPGQMDWLYGRTRHAGGINFVYADGHSTFSKPVKLEPGGGHPYDYGYYPKANVY